MKLNSQISTVVKKKKKQVFDGSNSGNSFVHLVLVSQLPKQLVGLE